MPTINKPSRKRKNESTRFQIRRKIYQSERWKKLREWKLVNSPLCEVCKSEDRITIAEEVHHIVSFVSVEDINEIMKLAYDYDNLMSICKQCHQLIHNKNK